jgi:hypothetical protein
MPNIIPAEDNFKWLGYREMPIPRPGYRVKLVKDEQITDSLLKAVPNDAQTIIIERDSYYDEAGFRHTDWSPVRIECRPEMLGAFPLKMLLLYVVMEGLETDSMFSHTTQLEYLWIGAHKNQMFSEFNHIPNFNMKAFGFNGCGLAMNSSETFKQYLNDHPDVKQEFIF